MPTDPTDDGAPDLVLRPAWPGDAEAVARIHLAARAAAPMPPSVHTDAEVGRWLAERLAADAAGDPDEVWVAERDSRVVGYLRLVGTWLDDLYVEPAHARTGVGSALLEVVKVRCPDGFGLWVFETNLPARAFYAAHGLVELRVTDGSDNEERAPDVELAWPGRSGRSGLG